ncbi:hypothetical protein DM02DRAFT_398812 [Periconia macrospinosa]|uniref:Uncharacterized protein n=1 Tax=Periconia macrospinosa TaxID=97972 RepID=A0A2V1DSS4_9PLEO|nr:hypothetical protein DM02DRAFT_398812 [Periconia macrospinosa]
MDRLPPAYASPPAISPTIGLCPVCSSIQATKQFSCCCWEQPLSALPKKRRASRSTPPPSRFCMSHPSLPAASTRPTRAACYTELVKSSSAPPAVLRRAIRQSFLVQPLHFLAPAVEMMATASYKKRESLVRRLISDSPFQHKTPHATYSHGLTYHGTSDMYTIMISSMRCGRLQRSTLSTHFRAGGQTETLHWNERHRGTRKPCVA